MDSLALKEKKNIPKLADNITARDQERNYAPGMLHTDTFDWLVNVVIFQLNFVSLSNKKG